MTEEEQKKQISELAKYLGTRGGEKTKQKYGKEHYKKISQQALLKRWGKKKEN
jgi:hypothetical protein